MNTWLKAQYQQIQNKVELKPRLKLREVQLLKKLRGFGAIAILCFSASCSIDNAKNHYLLAEKLWNDKKYGAAVSEFEKVTLKDPNGKLGLQALFRAATTQFLFLSQYNDAVQKFRVFTQRSSDLSAIWEAQLQIGEILFFRLEQYDQAIQHYQMLIKQKPNGVEVPEFMFRIAKSHFFRFQFKEAIQAYEDLMKKYPHTPYAEKAYFEIGTSHFTRGEQYSKDKDDRGNNEAYFAAKSVYEKFIQKYPKSELLPQAQFGVASCLEELDKLQDALEAYEKLKATYPAPRVIEIKMARIQERMNQRSR